MSLVVAYVVMCLQWCAANPAVCVMTLGAAASMLKDKLVAKWPATAKVMSLLDHVGVNLAGVRAELIAGVPVVAAKAVSAVEAAAPAVK